MGTFSGPFFNQSNAQDISKSVSQILVLPQPHRNDTDSIHSAMCGHATSSQGSLIEIPPAEQGLPESDSRIVPSLDTSSNELMHQLQFLLDA
jgi:hypothetical protein